MDDTDKWLGKAVESLRESEATYRGLFESLGEAIQICELVFDEKGQPIDNIILDVNPAYEKHSGLKREEVIGKRIKEIFPVVEQVWLDRYGEVVREGKSMHFEEFNASFDKWFDVHASPLGGNRFAAVFSDITEHKKAESRYRALFEQNIDGILIADLKTMQYVDCNKKAEEMTGYSREELLSMKIGDNTHPTVRDKILGIFCKKLEKGDTETFENKIIGKNKIKYMEISVNIIEIEGKNHAQIVFQDITEKKEAEKELKESEECFSSVLDNTRDVLVRFNLQTGVYEFVSPSVVDLVGYSPDDFINMDAITALKMIHPDDVSVLQEATARSNEVGYAEAEYRQRTKNGEYIWISNYMSVQKDNSGKPIYRISSIRDITERKKAEKALKESEENYSGLFESMNEGFVIGEMIYDDEGKPFDYRFIDINPAFEKFIGLSRDKVLGKTVRTLLPNVEPKAIENLGKVMLTGEQISWENYSRDRDGWFDVFAYRITPKHFAYLTLDITERKKADEALQESQGRLQSILLSLVEGVVIADSQGNLLDFNDAAVKIHGYKHESEWLMHFSETHDIFDLYSLDGKPIPVKDWPMSRVVNGETFIDYEVFVHRNDIGLKGIWSYGGSPVRDKDGNIILTIITVHDITERKEAEEALKQSEDRFAKSFRSSPAALAITRLADGTYIEVNDSVLAMMGYSREEMIGHTPRGNWMYTRTPMSEPT